MEGLREKVGEGKIFDRVAGANKDAKIARECRGIAGDIYQCGRSDLGEQRSHLCAEAGARRIDNDQVRALRFAIAAEEVERVGADCGGRGRGEIRFESRNGGGCGFDGDDVGKTGSKLAREKADTGEEI